MAMNLQGIWAIYRYEIQRTKRTALQSVVSPVVSTSLYFVVFGGAIGSRIPEIDGVPYGAFIVPGLLMLTLMMQSLSNASFAIYFPKFIGTIFEMLSAPVSFYEIVIGYVGAAATKTLLLGAIILLTAWCFVPLRIEHPVVMLLFLVLTAISFSLFGFLIGIWADNFEKLQVIPLAGGNADGVPGRQLLFHRYAAGVLADGLAVQPGAVSDQRFSLELLRHCRCERLD